MRTITIAAVATLCAGCVPYPHDVWVRPDIVGSVRSADMPVVGAEIYVGYSPSRNCAELSKVAATDQSGKFEVPAQRESRLMFDLINSKRLGQSIMVCLNTSAGLIYGGEFAARAWQRDRLTLVCEVWGRRGIDSTGYAAHCTPQAHA